MAMRWASLKRVKKIVFHFGTRSLSSSVRIGCASGFWGDTQESVGPLVRDGRLDFLVFDYLSEITMSLLATARRKDPSLGYTSDFVSFAMAPYLREIKSRGIRIVSNAGGLNPRSCADALASRAKKAGIELKIGVVLGDDLMPVISQMGSVTEWETGKSLPKVDTMNAYVGAKPIAEALNAGADVVITGRCVDSALALAPLLHVFNWDMNDWNKLAAGSLAGHVIECGAQSTGGIFTDWHLVPDWHQIGFPIAECFPSGEFIVTKPSNSGGMINRGTVAEQILYEVHDPNNYILPDVTCDFSNVTLQEVSDGIKVSGAKGKPPSSLYKVSATYPDGFRATAVSPIVGPRARDKALKTAEAILNRCELIFKRMNLPTFSNKYIEVLGSGSNYGAIRPLPELNTREAVLWIAVNHQMDAALKIFSREIAPAATGMAPGFTNLVGGRPKVSPVLKLFSFLYPKDKVKLEVWLNDAKIADYKADSFDVSSYVNKSNIHESGRNELKRGSETYSLKELAYTRSGDKGNTANIAVIARHSSFLPYIKSSLTAKSVAEYFKHVFEDAVNPEKCVDRYDVPGLNAVNFVLRESLGGGGIASMRSDPQGKAFGQILLDFKFEKMPLIEELIKNV